MIADKDTAYENFPTPLLNRLEKHFLATSTMLTDGEKEVQSGVEKWAKKYSKVDTLGSTRYIYSYIYMCCDIAGSVGSRQH